MLVIALLLRRRGPQMALNERLQALEKETI